MIGVGVSSVIDGTGGRGGYPTDRREIGVDGNHTLLPLIGDRGPHAPIIGSQVRIQQPRIARGDALHAQ